MNTYSDLLNTSLDEKLRALRDAGATKDNINGNWCIYIVNGNLLAASHEDYANPDLDNGILIIENIGFWAWAGTYEYHQTTENIDDIHKKIRTGFELNLVALKNML